MMLDNETLQKCKQDYDRFLPLYQTMQKYYNGETDAKINYQEITKRANNKVGCNFIQKFINEEASYVCGNKITFLSHSGNQQEIEDIRMGLKHWSLKHNRELCKQALIFNEAYELYFTDDLGQFSPLICTPLNSYVLYDLDDDYGEATNIPIKAFIRFFYKKFDTAKTCYADVYSDDGDIAHYTVTGSSFLQIPNSNVDHNTFSRVPVGIVNIGSVYESLFSILKGLQDGYETNLSDIVNEISDFRNAYLVLVNSMINDKDKDADGKTQADKMKENGIMSLKKDGDAKWLIKNINDSFVQNTLNTLEDKMYQLASHINNNEKMVSNTSSLALRNRLIGLEQRCANNIEAMTDDISTRIQLLFEYLHIKQGSDYDWRDIDPKFTPCIPTDDLMMAQIISQLNGKISNKTGISQLSFVDNPDNEMKQLKEENKANDVGQGLLDSAAKVPPPVGSGDTA